jgi:hypothetical protein
MSRALAIALGSLCLASLAGCRITYVEPRGVPAAEPPIVTEPVLTAPDHGDRGVEIFVDYDFNGASTIVHEGFTDIDQLGIPNDTLSALKIPRGYRVTLYEHAHGQGRSIHLDADTPRVPRGWNDLTSSIRVERARGPFGIGHPTFPSFPGAWVSVGTRTR